MPGGDRSGPNGLGQMTGRGQGFCAGFPKPGYANFLGGRGGCGRGFGIGRGFGRGVSGRFINAQNQAYYPNNSFPMSSVSKADQLNALTEQAKMIQDDLLAINQQIKELESKES